MSFELYRTALFQLTEKHARLRVAIADYLKAAENDFLGPALAALIEAFEEDGGK